MPPHVPVQIALPTAPIRPPVPSPSRALILAAITDARS